MKPRKLEIDMGNIDTIFIHCSATRADWMIGKPLADKVSEIKRWHTDPKPKGRGWRDIGYHWLIDRDGRAIAGRTPETRPGAHARGHNEGSIAICLLGGHGSSENDAFEDNFTPEQDAALRKLIAEIGARHPIKHVRGHNEVAAKACPGFNVSMWWAGQVASSDNGAARPAAKLQPNNSEPVMQTKTTINPPLASKINRSAEIGALLAAAASSGYITPEFASVVQNYLIPGLFGAIWVFRTWFTDPKS